MWGEVHYDDGYCWGDWGGDSSFTYICEEPIPYARTGWAASASSYDGSHSPQKMIDGDLTDSYWWSNGDYDWIMIDMGVSQPVGRVFVDFGWWYNDGCCRLCVCTKTIDHYVSMEVKVGDNSYAGQGHGSRVSGGNTLCHDHTTTKPSQWEIWFVCNTIVTGRYVTIQKYL